MMISDRQASALDAALAMSKAFEETLSKHPFILQDPALVARCHYVEDLLGQLYQQIGLIDDPDL